MNRHPLILVRTCATVVTAAATWVDGQEDQTRHTGQAEQTSCPVATNRGRHAGHEHEGRP